MPVFVHIGVPKSGTSTLQQRVFPRHPDIDFCGFPPPEAAPEFHAALFKDNMYCDAAMIGRARAELGSFIPRRGRPSVLSREHLTYFEFNIGLIAERLVKVFGDDLRIILTIREQTDQLLSSFLWTLRPAMIEITRVSLPRYVDTQMRNFTLAQSEGALRNWSAFTSADYGAIVRHYERVIGKERIGIFLFEEMVRDPAAFCARLFRFIGVEPVDLGSLGRTNERISAAQYRYWRKMRPLPEPIRKLVRARLSPAYVEALDEGPKAEIVMPRHLRSRVEAIVAPGNRYLAENYGLPLGEYGYAL